MPPAPCAHSNTPGSGVSSWQSARIRDLSGIFARQDQRVLDGIGVIAVSHARQPKSRARVETTGGAIRPADFKCGTRRAERLGLGQDARQQLAAKPPLPQLGADGQVVDVNLVDAFPERAKSRNRMLLRA